MMAAIEPETKAGVPVSGGVAVGQVVVAELLGLFDKLGRKDALEGGELLDCGVRMPAFRDRLRGRDWYDIDRSFFLS